MADRVKGKVAVVAGELAARAIAACLHAQGATVVTPPDDFTTLDDAAWQNFLAQVMADHGRLDILVLCACPCPPASLAELSLAAFQNAAGRNALAAFLATRHAVAAMGRDGGHGAIIHVAPTSDQAGVATAAVAGAARLMAKATALEVGAARAMIRVNTVHVASSPVTPPPLGAMPSDDDVAQGVLYLASDDGSFATGMELVIDGGGAIV